MIKIRKFSKMTGAIVIKLCVWLSFTIIKLMTKNFYFRRMKSIFFEDSLSFATVYPNWTDRGGGLSIISFSQKLAGGLCFFLLNLLYLITANSWR